ncbi:MAG: hypothetical protein CMA49_06235 [Euryarchaeota archaeon]|nr:hypothetical protein [Euryarchaeota archaeon]
MQLKAILLSAVVAMIALSPVIEANSGGKHFSSGGCGCHGGSSSSVVISENFPSTYNVGQTYSIQISVSGGVSGTHGGFNVEVDKGSLATGGNSGVKVSGKSVTHSNKANRVWNFDWTAPPSGSGTVSVGIAGMTANGASGTNGDAWRSTSISITETVVETNNPPTASNVQITPSFATSSDDLTLSYTFDDQDGDGESGTSIHWLKNGVRQTQHDGLLFLSKSFTTRNDDWQVEVTPGDGEDFGNTANSNIVTVFNAPPTITSTSISPPTPTPDDELTALVSDDNDNDGDVLTFEYRWLLDGALQSGLNNLSSLPSYATRLGDVWEVEIRAYDGEDYSSWTRSTSVSVEGQTSNTPPVVDSITISPLNPTTMDSLTASITSSDADMDSITDVEYRWLKNGAQTGITSSQLESVETKKGELWSIEARVNDGTDWSLWTSSSSIQIMNTAPVIEDASLSVTEALTTDDIAVTATMSDVDGDQLHVRAAWYLEGVLQTTYNDMTTLPSDATSKGDVWTVVVQSDDGMDTSTGSQTLTVIILNAEPSVVVDLTENVTSQDTLSLETVIEDIDGDTTEIESVTWFRNGFREASLDDATNVPSSYLGPGQEWSVEVVISDGEATVLSSAAVLIENAPPVAEITVLTDSLYAGERAVLSGINSADPDNSIVRYRWTWAGGGATGIEASLIMPQSDSVEVTLFVTDVSGAINSTSLTLSPIPALPCPSLTSIVSGEKVILDWTWTSPETASFEITRNGVLVGVTSATTITDMPSITGTSTYQVQTMLGDRVLESPCQSSTVEASIESSSTEYETAPSSIAGLSLGIVYAVLGILLFVASLLRRSD